MSTEPTRNEKLNELANYFDNLDLIKNKSFDVPAFLADFPKSYAVNSEEDLHKLFESMKDVVDKYGEKLGKLQTGYEGMFNNSSPSVSIIKGRGADDIHKQLMSLGNHTEYLRKPGLFILLESCPETEHERMVTKITQWVKGVRGDWVETAKYFDILHRESNKKITDRDKNKRVSSKLKLGKGNGDDKFYTQPEKKTVASGLMGSLLKRS